MNDYESPMFTLFEMTPDLVCIVNKEGYFKKVNPAVIHKLGYTEEELMKQPVSHFIHPDDKERTALNRTDLLNNRPLLNFQNRYVTSQGAVIWLEWTSIYLPEKETVFAIAKDITARKKMEIELEENYHRFKTLTMHFKNNMEKDRSYFVGALHEDLAQMAAVIKMNIGFLQAEEGLSLVGRERLLYALQTTDHLIGKMKKIAYSIGTDKIVNLPLDEVLQGLCSDFSTVSGIECRYKSNIDDLPVSYEVRLDLFRICQEALLNVVQHANATLVKISLQYKDGDLQLSISDNGQGFDQENPKQSFGLATMQGRAISINGSLSIKSSNKGTTLRLRLAEEHILEKA